MPAAMYDQLCAHLRGVANLDAVSRMLEWDQETQMPTRAAGGRADQIAAVAALAHEQRTSARVDEMLRACESDRSLSADEATARIAGNYATVISLWRGAR